MHVLVWLFSNLSKQKRKKYRHIFIRNDCSVKCMPKISAVGLFCLDRFENNQTRTCTTFFRTSKLTELYFSHLSFCIQKHCLISRWGCSLAVIEVALQGICQDCLVSCLFTFPFIEASCHPHSGLLKLFIVLDSSWISFIDTYTFLFRRSEPFIKISIQIQKKVIT